MTSQRIFQHKIKGMNIRCRLVMSTHPSILIRCHNAADGYSGSCRARIGHEYEEPSRTTRPQKVPRLDLARARSNGGPALSTEEEISPGPPFHDPSTELDRRQLHNVSPLAMLSLEWLILFHDSTLGSTFQLNMPCQRVSN